MLKISTRVAKEKNVGFTIVELLIVIVVIGILAAIVIVAFNGVQNSAKEATLKSDLANAKKKLVMYRANNSSFPVNVTQLGNAEIVATKSMYDTTANNFYYCINRVTGEFAIGARTTSGASSFVVSSVGEVRKISGVSGDSVCQEVGLTGWADTNGFISNGHGNGTGWQAWVG